MKEQAMVARAPISASPLPWTQNVLQVVDATGREVVHVTRWHGQTPKPEDAERDAAYITHAANRYPQLLAALKDCHRILAGGMQEDYDQMTAALGRAREAIADSEVA